MWGVFFVSAAVLGYEVALMRILLVASWHHFAFLVISLALLGFGASGTILTLARDRVLALPGPVFDGLLLASAVSMPVCAAVMERLPVEAAVVPVLMWRQLGWWLVFWAVAAVPFLLGATAVGLALMATSDRVASVYAANLLGSAVGAAGITAAMEVVEPAWLPAVTGATALVAFVGRAGPGHRTRLLTAGLTAIMVGGWLAVEPMSIRPDPYKYAAHVERLVAQGRATEVAVATSPRAAVRVYSSDVFHDLPFLGMGAAPPAMDSLTLDGHHAGSLLEVDGPEDAAALDTTLMSAPYDLVSARPRVALLGERDGVNVWLAVRRQASRVAVVQPDETLLGLLRGPLGSGPGRVFARPDVEVVTVEPRHFVDQTGDTFDLVQLVTLQSLSVGAGMAGLAEDHLATVEGLSAALDRLEHDGVLSVSRAIQTPPRDNLKLWITLADALERRGATEPGRHLAVVRDYLGVCTMVRPTPWTDGDVARIRDVVRRRHLTPVWFPGVRTDELNHPDALPGAEGQPGDWYHHAAARLFAGEGDGLVAESVYDLRPPTDARPFFTDFTRLDSVGVFRTAFGDLWLTRVELAYLFVLASAGAVAVAGFLLTLAPVLLARPVRRSPGKLATAAYFTALGLGYLLLEMALLSRVAFLVGDPVTAAAVVLTAFLLLSGVGSALAQRVDAAKVAPVAAAVLGITVVASALAAVLGMLTGWVGGSPVVVRSAAAVAALAPLALLMGFPMPLGLARLHRGAPSLVPLAWGVNGFASVLAAPLAVLLAMTWSYRVVTVAAVGLYLAAALVFAALPVHGSSTRDP
jgi:hypothetical protein